MKKLAALLIVLSLALFSFGCGGQGATEGGAGGEPEGNAAPAGGGGEPTDNPDAGGGDAGGGGEPANP